MERGLIAKLPNAIQNGLNEINDDRTVPRKTGRETEKENRNTIWDKRNRGGQKRRKLRHKKSPNEFHMRAIQKTMINRLPARTRCALI